MDMGIFVPWIRMELMVALHWEKYMQHAREVQQRTFITITLDYPHICRYSYCTNMANSGMNPKTLQYLMGHSDVSDA